MKVHNFVKRFGEIKFLSLTLDIVSNKCMPLKKVLLGYFFFL